MRNEVISKPQVGVVGTDCASLSEVQFSNQPIPVQRASLFPWQRTTHQLNAMNLDDSGIGMNGRLLVKLDERVVREVKEHGENGLTLRLDNETITVKGCTIDRLYEQAGLYSLDATVRMIIQELVIKD